MVNKTEGSVGTQVQRETGITLALIDIILERPQTAEVIDIGLCVHIQQDTEFIGKRIFEHTTQAETKCKVVIGDLLPRMNLIIIGISIRTIKTKEFLFIIS